MKSLRINVVGKELEIEYSDELIRQISEGYGISIDDVTDDVIVGYLQSEVHAAVKNMERLKGDDCGKETG